jgi:hypothetical protein
MILSNTTFYVSQILGVAICMVVVVLHKLANTRSFSNPKAKSGVSLETGSNERFISASRPLLTNRIEPVATVSQNRRKLRTFVNILFATTGIATFASAWMTDIRLWAVTWLVIVSLIGLILILATIEGYLVYRTYDEEIPEIAKQAFQDDSETKRP